MKLISENYKKIIIFFLYFIFFVIGLFIFKDYGIGFEENFQKSSGFYWLSYLSDLFGFENLKNFALLKKDELYSLNPNLPPVEKNLAYGILFDLPAALAEILFDFENKNYNTYLRHFLSFFVFFISSFCFTCILIKRFSNFIVTIIGTIAYFFSPKIFGASFFDGKDIFFLSVLTITMFLFQNYTTNKNFINLLVFSVFAAFCFSSRTPGLMVFFSFLLIYIFKILSEENVRRNSNILIIFITSYFIFLIITWPYLWNFTENFNYSYGEINQKVFFNGHFYNQKTLPLSYIPKLILITTPVYIILFFTIGFFLTLRRIYLRTILIKNNSKKKYNYDFWRGKKEEFDFFIFINFFQAIFIYLTFTSDIFSSWRHFYFVHFFLIYFFSLSINNLLIFLKKFKKIQIILSLFLIFANIEMIYKVYLFHPFQNSYFNNFLNEESKKKYEIDTAQLSRLIAIRDIIEDNKDNNKIIKIASASWSPLEDVLIFFNKKNLKNIQIIGYDDLINADYIFTNYIYDVNIIFNERYDIPSNFYKLKSIFKDGILIYTIYKKK